MPKPAHHSDRALSILFFRSDLVLLREYYKPTLGMVLIVITVLLYVVGLTLALMEYWKT